jgi:integral membrane sensor domain MASE1
MWLGGALGVAIFTAVATSTTTDRLAEHASRAEALTAGFQDALLLAAIFLAGAAVIALRSPNTRGEQAALELAAAPEPATEAA